MHRLLPGAAPHPTSSAACLRLPVPGPLLVRRWAARVRVRPPVHYLPRPVPRQRLAPVLRALPLALGRVVERAAPARVVPREGRGARLRRGPRVTRRPGLVRPQRRQPPLARPPPRDVHPEQPQLRHAEVSKPAQAVLRALCRVRPPRRPLVREHRQPAPEPIDRRGAQRGLEAVVPLLGAGGVVCAHPEGPVHRLGPLAYVGEQRRPRGGVRGEPGAGGGEGGADSGEEGAVARRVRGIGAILGLQVEVETLDAVRPGDGHEGGGGLLGLAEEEAGRGGAVRLAQPHLGGGTGGTKARSSLCARGGEVAADCAVGLHAHAAV
mmetsp:Transcript_2503/g.8917  ORF Transcript_2503/g.8917 Transcript_2503/m.8917 type:complete len:323 (+) Transcript_2503:357-1325(+)